MSAARVLVVGARGGSLGEAVREAALCAGYEPLCAGISGEPISMDCHLTPMEDMVSTLRGLQPRFVVCTAGVNMPQPEDMVDPVDWYRWHFEANVTGPMRLLYALQEASNNADYLPESGMLHYVAISSNSARLPRSSSAAYCASKAALSMALRVAAREGRGGDQDGILVYGYEPGLLAGTPMTRKTEDRWGIGTHRMRGFELEKGIPVTELATLIVQNFRRGPAINGTLIPYDAGET